MKNSWEDKRKDKHPLKIEMSKRNRIKILHSLFKYNITCPYFTISRLSRLSDNTVKSLQRLFLLHRKHTAVKVSHATKDNGIKSTHLDVTPRYR